MDRRYVVNHTFVHRHYVHLKDIVNVDNDI